MSAVRILLHAGKRMAWGAALAFPACGPAVAGPQDADPAAIVVTAPKRTRCAATDYACLTGETRVAAQAARRDPPAATSIDADTPSRVGTFSRSATAQRMGRNFGRAATPYRPPAPAYASPITGGRPR